ncbi:GNAT family N-acetyltransferase [Methanolacinia petrolearia]|uniref:GNAT family N-acetyltransferase n=1 Tax=Methanolacinia petrolearia TaxID=54120 RepID=UPI003BA8B38D
MTRDINFREVTEDDLEVMNSLVNDEDIARFLDLIPPVPMSKTIDFWEFAVSRGAMWWAILIGNDVIGSVGVVPEDSDGKMSHVGAMFVYLLKDHRGLGYGGIAIDHALFMADVSGLKRIGCLTAEGNSRAIAMYLEKGFLIGSKEGCIL